MPTGFYARYVPPPAATAKSGVESVDINPRPAKRSKLEKQEKTEAKNRDRTPQQRSDEHQEPVKKKLRRVKRTEEPPGEDIDPSDGLKKHEPVKKKHKSVKRTAGLLEEEIDLSEQDGLEKHDSIRAKYQRSRLLDQTNEAQQPVQKIDQTLEQIRHVGLQPLPQPKPVHRQPEAIFSALPKWLMEPHFISSDTRVPFDSLLLDEKTLKHLSKAGFEQAFAIQAAVLPMLLPGPQQHYGDICVSAATGSGKTLAYTLPIIHALKNKPTVLLRALIIVPTRELVEQVKKVFHITGSSLKVGTAVGSKSLESERRTLVGVEDDFDNYTRRFSAYGGLPWLRNSTNLLEKKTKDQQGETSEEDDGIKRYSKVDVLICTPGRLVDHLRSTKGFTLKHLQWLVIDEADRLLDQSFQEWLDTTIPALDRKKNRSRSSLGRQRSLLRPAKIIPIKKVILSATMTRDYSKLVALDLVNPVLVAIEGSDVQGLREDPMADIRHEQALASLPESLSEVFIRVDEAPEKPLYLVQLIENSLGNLHIKQAAPKAPKVLSFARTASENTSSSGSSSETDSDEESSISSLSDTESDLGADNFNQSDNDFTPPEEDSNDKGTSSASEDDSSHKEPVQKEIPHQPHKLLKSLSIDDASSHGMLIFTNTNESALRLCYLLELLRPQWTARLSVLTKSVGTSTGRKALAAFRNRKIDILVATDMASRGLDLKNLAHVINYDMPRSLTTYVHRVGRTARAGHEGTATSLVAYHEARWFWQEIGDSQQVERAGKVKRANMELKLSEDDRAAYEIALKRLEKEVKGAM